MIVYHLTHQDKLRRYFQEGVKRSETRIYVFPNFEHIELCIDAMAMEDNGQSSIEQYRVLVLNVDEDQMLRAPIPRASLPVNLKPETVEQLQAESCYIETDLAKERIIGVKTVYGDNETAKHRVTQARTSNIPRFLKFVKPYWRFVLGATLMGFAKFLIPVAFPWMLRTVLDDVILRDGLDAAERNATILHLTLMMIGLNLLWMGATFCRSVFTATAGNSMIRDLRLALYNHVQRLSHHFFTSRQSGAIVTRLVNDISQAQNFVGHALTNLWMDLVLMVVLLAILIPLNWKLTLVALCLMPLFLFSIRHIGRRIRLSSQEVQQRMEVLAGGLQEKVAGVVIVKGFTREREESDVFRTQANKLYSKVLRSVRYMACNEMIVGFVVLTSPVLVVWQGSHLIIQGELTVGQLTQFLLYLGMFYGPLQRMSDLGAVLASSLASIDRVFEYFDTAPQVTDKPEALPLKTARGHLVFDDVTFGYDQDKPVLKDISLEIQPGETVAFVGPSGSGKSTLANLAPRFYDPDKGRILLDGHDLRDVQLDSLRQNIGIVNQETILFSGTVRENLLLAKPDAEPDELMAALKAANALQFVDELPEGLWTEIGERGLKLSGGQKQRLAIARAFLKNPRILILDEATSALDSRSERLIQEALRNLLQDRTAIVIAHRLSTILNADKIAALDRGRIIECGSHHVLLEQGGLYAQLFEEQFGALSAEA
ncbi:ABC transporter ATP-binding protein [Candidatus Sumerlaeota bacterium]|nr:ABC transporter ATP-binding protein [Candidatus Sumerlaeota bacterium]